MSALSGMHQRASLGPSPAAPRPDGRIQDSAAEPAQAVGVPLAGLGEWQRAQGDNGQLAFELSRVLTPSDSARPSSADLCPRGQVQAELEVGSVHDPLEREADQIARVLTDGAACGCGPPNGPACSHHDGHTPTARLQRRMEGGGHNRVGSMVSGVALGAGQPLAAEHRGFFEPRLGVDLSSVRIHTDTRAAEAAVRLGARAFTVGHDVAFARAKFRPDIGEGRRLLAHELAHVVQQRGPASSSDVIRRQGPAGDPGTAVGATVIGDVLPPPFLVTWGPDSFLVSFARASPGDEVLGLGGVPGDVLMVRLRYAGSLPVDGVGVKDRTWAAGVNVGPRMLSARVRRQGPTFVQLDLYGDSSTFLRVTDEPEVDPSPATAGRRHKLGVSLNIGGGLYGTVWVRDPTAKASDLPPPAPEDRPGSMPRATSVPGDWGTVEMPIDGDGDQHAELVLRLGPDSRGKPGGPPADQRRVRLSVRTLAGESLLDVAGDLAAPATAGDLWPLVKSITDGDKPTRISLVLPMDTQWLTIEPPKTADTASAYGVNFAGFHILVPAKGARGKIGNVPEAGVTGGIIYNDLTLGAYDDRFRLTLQWRSGSRALLGMSPLYRGAATGGYGVEIAASGVLRCQIVEVTPVSLGFDLDGDGKADLRLYDELTSPSWNGKDMPERDRNHTVRIVGTAVGGEKSFDFQIRSGLPMRAGFDTPENKTAASNAMAVSGLNEQRKNASYEAQFDQYEMAMMRVRADAAAAGTIGQPTYDAWRALSEDMIKLQPQQGPGGTVQQALKDTAALHAAAFNAA